MDLADYIVKQLTYYPATGGMNGQFKSSEIYVMTENSDEWTLAGSFTDRKLYTAVKKY